MSDKKKKDIPAQEPENETAAPVTEETENTEAPAEEAAPKPVCPYCLEEVNEGATKCCHCGSELPKE